MNKQNKKIAQEKRRIEREKAEKKAKVVNLLKFWVPVVAVVVVVSANLGSCDIGRFIVKGH